MQQTIFSDLFTRNNSIYNLRSKFDFVIPQMTTVFKGSSSISCYGQIIWSLVSEKIRCRDSLESVKGKMRKWKPKYCPCICKKYIPNAGF